MNLDTTIGKSSLGSLILALTVGCSMSPEARIVREAADALGGAEFIESVHTLVLEGSGEAYNFGQNSRPDAPPPPYEVSRYVRSIDFESKQWKQEIVGLARFPPPFPVSSTEIIAIDNQLAYDLDENGEAVRRPTPISWSRQAQLYHHPLGILKAALDSDARVLSLGTVGGEDGVEVITGDGIELALWVNSVSGLPSRVQSLSYDPILGDIVIESAFADYTEVADLNLPTRIIMRVDRYLNFSVTVSTHVNAATGDLEAPRETRSQPLSTPVARVEVEDVGRGLWYLRGESHHSVVVEFADHLTVIEAPQNDIRTLAVIETARQLRPDKPVTEVINTHHHFDHLGGIRAAISEGLTIITDEANRSFYQDIAARPHTLFPDALESSRRSPVIVEVSESHILSDATRRIEIYPIEDSPHADTLVMIYVPAERILVIADVYSTPDEESPDGRFPYVANLLRNIDNLNLRVDRVLPLHGRAVPFEEVIAAAATERRAAEVETPSPTTP